ncbi:MAG TPA: two-component system response regulator [Elusimicrobia bacterium]|nr:MAG: hypothetical protein A2X37_08590 [Elusimicrobia bacterium GWA2_66_18]OGR69753.1 MAG: hypothetical protein A2X40_09990 [Elusimicrobia bacterium GWC2_65_9]HAZ06950.1 two-component system response regulator [Elusimicrobiota bacterium]
MGVDKKSSGVKTSAWRVLITDDSMITRMFLKNMLESNGYTVVGEAKNAQEALDLYKETRPDFTTMDMNMPDSSGLEAIKSICEFDTDAKFIIISAVDQKLVRDQYAHMGACEYVPKPAEWSKLAAAISRLSKKIVSKSPESES